MFEITRTIYLNSETKQYLKRSFILTFLEVSNSNKNNWDVETRNKQEKVKKNTWRVVRITTSEAK